MPQSYSSHRAVVAFRDPTVNALARDPMNDDQLTSRSLLGTDVVFEDDLTIGDLVILVGKLDGRLAVRRLRVSAVDAYKGPIFRLEPGQAPNSCTLRLFRHGAA